MTNKQKIEEKIETITEAAALASEKIYEARCILEEASGETGYIFDNQIMQEVEDGYMSGLRRSLEDLANGDKNSELRTELGGEENEDEDLCLDCNLPGKECTCEL